jgi:hypothetical protein
MFIEALRTQDITADYNTSHTYPRAQNTTSLTIVKERAEFPTASGRANEPRDHCCWTSQAGMGLQTERGFLTAAGEREARAEAARGIGKVLETVDAAPEQTRRRRRAQVCPCVSLREGKEHGP